MRPKTKMLKIMVPLFFLLASSYCFADDEAAVQYFKKGEAYFEDSNYEKALNMYNKAVKERRYDGVITIRIEKVRLIPYGGIPKKEITYDEQSEDYYPNRRIAEVRRMLEELALPSDLFVKARFVDSNDVQDNNCLDPGENGELVVSIKNSGKGSAFATNLEVVSDSREIDFNRSVNIGDIQPGETKEIKVSLKAGMNIGAGESAFNLNVKEKRGYGSKPVVVDVPTVKLEKPALEIVTAEYNDKTSSMPNNRLDADEEAEMILTIKNNGKGKAESAKLEITTDNSRISFDRYIDLGNITPGTVKKVRVNLKASLGISDGKSAIKFNLKEARGYDARLVTVNVPTAKLDSPVLEIVGYEINDGDTGLAKGNGNGIAESDETVELIIFVENKGTGKAVGVNLSGDNATSGLQWVQSSTSVGTIPPGEKVKAQVAFTIPRSFDASKISTTLKAIDSREGVSDTEKKITLSYGKRMPDLQYTYRILSGGTPVKTITNGEEYELELTVNNSGSISARDVVASISLDSGIYLSPSSIELREIKDRSSALGQRFRFSVPRSFNKKEIPLNIEMSQADFSTVKDSKKIPVDIRSPKLKYTVNLQGKRGGNSLEKGEETDFEVIVFNEGTMPAEGVTVKVESGDNKLQITGQKEKKIGKLPPQKSSIMKFSVFAYMQIDTGNVPVNIDISQSDFREKDISSQFALNIVEEGSTVFDITADENKKSSGAKKQAGPKIALKTTEIPDMTNDETLRLAFDVADAVKNIDTVKIEVNGVLLALGAAEGMTHQVSKAKSIDISSIPLIIGLNKIIITARNSDYSESRKELTVTRMAEEDVDTPPLTGVSNPDAVAVVIGISKYKNKEIPGVDYAQRDAAVMKEYMVKTLGYKKENIMELYDSDATLPDVRTNLISKLKRKGKEKDIFVFFSGHGTHDPDSKEAYLIPYDFDPEDTENRGFPVKELYKALEEIKDAKSITVVLDACFSGFSGDGKALIKGVSAITFEVTNPLLRLKNARVFTSSQKKEYSNWYPEKRHGLFTYYFLQGLRGKADRNNDGQVAIKEMEEYLVKNVPEQAMSLHNRIQVPAVIADRDAVLVRYK